MALLELSHRLEDLNTSNADKDFILGQIADNASGVTPFYTKITFGGIAAGNLGLSPECASRIPFCPSDYRGMDDSLYEKTVRHLAPGMRSFGTKDPKQMLSLESEIPVARHVKERGKPNISSILLDEMKGSVLIKVLERRVLMKQKGKLEEELRIAAKETFREYAMPKFIGLFGRLSGTIGGLDPGIRTELERIMQFKETDLLFDVNEVQAHADRFEHALELWPKLVREDSVKRLATDTIFNP